jgi:hypothetical protein
MTDCLRDAEQCSAGRLLSPVLLVPRHVSPDDVKQDGLGNVICIVTGGDLVGMLQYATTVQGLTSAAAQPMPAKSSSSSSSSSSCESC